MSKGAEEYILTQEDLFYYKGLKSQDTLILEKVYSRFQKPVIRMVKKMGGTEADGADAFQEGIIGAYLIVEKTDIPKINIPFPKFLKLIAKRKWISEYHRKKNNTSYSDEIGMAREDSLEEKWEKEIRKMERIRKIQLALEQLTDGCKDLLHLSIIEGKTNEDILQITNLKNSNTVASSKSRCMKKLKELLQKQEKI